MQQVLVAESPTGWGIDFTYDCTGNTDVMRSALEASHRGWGEVSAATTSACLCGVRCVVHGVRMRCTMCCRVLTNHAVAGNGIAVIQACMIGVAASGHEISTRPFNLIIGRTWKGTAFGGWKTRDAIPMLVKRSMNGEIPIDHFITHNFNGVGETTKAIDALHGGDCLRAVVKYCDC